ncbi:MAG: ATP-binding protein [Mariniphaga sp.]
MTGQWYTRFYEKMSDSLLEPGKVLVFYGPRRVGKTELVRAMLSSYKGRIYRGTGDNQELRALLESQQLTKISSLLGSYDLIFIDEAQRIPQIGYGLKLLVDNHPNVSIVITGSSSLDLSSQIGEPLTGRNKIRTLFPLSAIELFQQFGGIEVTQMLEQLLIFGSYPEVLKAKSKQDKVEYLLSIRDSYLLKDILEMENVRNRSKLSDLLKLLSFQIGHEVSINELSNNLGIAKQSVERYLDLLEKTFIIKRVRGFSRNLRSEITKTARYYFYDNGIRNSLINNFNFIDQRDDIGMLWENFLFIERLKKQEYQRLFSNNYFWRTYNRQEIDLVEERDGRLFGFEFKWKPRKLSAPKIWKDTYPDSNFEVISKLNFLEFII